MRCTVCESDNLRPLLKIKDVPVFCNVQWSTKEAARDAAVGNIALQYCLGCGHIFNCEFEPEKVEYSESYENSLHFSPHFQAHAEQLVERLVEKYDLRRKIIVEIGCGKGEFISMLCNAGNNTGYGFDASYQSDRESRATSDAVKFVKDFYGERYSSINADFVCSRHVLEHIQFPVPFLRDVQTALGSTRDAVVYFEVPNVLYSIEDMGIWDFIYEHCSYFSKESAETAFSKAGLRTFEIYTDFGNQFLCVESRPGHEAPGTAPAFADRGRRTELVTRFSKLYEEKLCFWNSFLGDTVAAGERVVIWGAGSKGVTFLNCIDNPNSVEHVVDVNPNKHGKFIAGTGHKIIDLDSLKGNPPSHVIIMNPIYKLEIQAMLSDLGIHATVSCA
jgi:hypothetical protein